MLRKSIIMLWLGCGTVSLGVHASCGSAVCSLASHFDGMGLTSNKGWQIDLRYEYIKQDQLRSGVRKTDPEFVDGEHTEIHTRNNNLVATLDYSANNRWGVSLQIPYVQRDHYHIFDNSGMLEDETWKFGSPGDLRIIGRYMLETRAASNTQTGIQLGVILPTGKTDVTNSADEAAERSLQPGTGTTGLILGYFRSRDIILFDYESRGFVQVQAQAAMSEHEAYRPGIQYRFNSGIVFRPAARFTPIVQLNALIKGRDHGANAEPADSGGEYLWISPGISKQLSHSLRIYGFVQLPLYQHVNGTQLTSDWTASIGINWQL